MVTVLILLPLFCSVGRNTILLTALFTTKKQKMVFLPTEQNSQQYVQIYGTNSFYDY
jgi:hypothetical protein